jgi:hypothetical protein
MKGEFFLSEAMDLVKKANLEKKNKIKESEKYLVKAIKPIPKEKYKTCEYCQYYKGTHCEKRIKRNRVFERCQYYSYDKNRGEQTLTYR